MQWRSRSREESFRIGAKLAFFMEGPEMSRIATPVSSQTSNTAKVAHEKIAMRAYEKWVKRGQQHGSHEQDWIEAETELKAEMARGATGTPSSYSPPRR